MLRRRTIESALGPLLLAGGDAGLAAIVFLGDQDADVAAQALVGELGLPVMADHHPLLARVERQVTAYLRGQRRGFALPLDLHGTPFQRRVWEALLHVPYGATVTYGELAAQLGEPKATRAVAQACGRNPVPIVVPCHRVVASDGLGGFSSGLPLKRRLLALERQEGSPLPLFAVAEARAQAAQVRARQASALEHLPARLVAWLDHKVAGRPLPGEAASDADSWVAAVVEVSDDRDLAALVEHFATHPGHAQTPLLHVLAQELLRAARARLSARWPEPATLRSLLVAALHLGPPWLEVIGREVGDRPRLPAAQREVLEQFYRDVMEGRRPAISQVRECAVDLWARLQPGSWSVQGAADKSAALLQAGLFQEAALTAEEALARGDGDRVTLLRRLVDTYLALGDPATARERLVSLLAEHDDPALRRRLRQLDDA